MHFPLITIITPTYNRADYLPETMDSVLSQGYPNLEYIVLDDGSKDDTISVLKQYEGKIIWDSHPNMGEVRTVNKGFSMAHGEIIGVVNSDDPLLPGAIQSIAHFMQENPEIGVVYPDWDYINAEGQKTDHIRTFEYSYINMLRWHHCMPGPAAFFRKEVVEALGGRDPQFRYVSDFDFWLRAGLITEFARLPQTLATFRMHPGSASSSQTNERMAQEHITLVEKIFTLPNLTNEVKNFKKEAYSSAYYIAGCVCQVCDGKVRKGYFLKAIQYAPLKYIGEYFPGRVLHVILPIFFPWLRRVYYVVKHPSEFGAMVLNALRSLKKRMF